MADYGRNTQRVPQSEEAVKLTHKHNEYLGEASDSLTFAVHENNLRLQYWDSRIYWQHGCRDPSRIGDSFTTRLQSPPFEGTNPIVSVRYLVLELWIFNELYEHNYKEMTNIPDFKDPTGLHSILRGYEREIKLISRMRNRFVAHHDWTFRNAAEEINKVGLHTIMRYARAVQVFQYGLLRTMPNPYYRLALTMAAQPPISIKLRLMNFMKFINEYHTRTEIPDSVVRTSKYVAFCESLYCLGVLQANFSECAKAFNKETLKTSMQYICEICNIKYMILEIHNIINFFKEMNIPIPPNSNFMQREKEYHNIRNHYCAHTNLDNIKGITQLLQENGVLITNLASDMMEIFEHFINPYGIFPDLDTCEIRFMLEREMLNIDKEATATFNACLKFHNWQTGGDKEKQRMLDEEEMLKKLFGLK